MGLVKKILIGIFSLVLLIVIAIGVIVATVDPNDYRGKITEVVKDKTGRDLYFDNIELAFFPKLGANLENVTLSNATGFEDEQFLKVSKIQISVAIIPLFSSQLEVDTLTLHGLDLRLARNADGVANWDDLIQPSEAEADVAGKTKETKENPLDQLASLNFGGLDIRDGQVHWNDQQAKQVINLTDFNFVTSAITFGEFFNIDLSAHTKLSEPELSAQVTLNLDAKFDKNGAFEVKNLKQTSKLNGKIIPVEELLTELSIPTLNINLEQEQVSLPKVELNYTVKGGKDFPAKNLDGAINIDNLSANLKEQIFATDSVKVSYNLKSDGSIPIDTAKGTLSLSKPSFSMADEILTSGPLTLQGDLTGKELPNGKATIQLSAQPALNLKKDTAALANLKLNALDLNANGSINITKLTNEPVVTANLDIPTFNLRQLLKQLGLDIPAVNEMSDKNTLTKVAAKLNVNFDSKTEAVAVKNIQITLDETALTGDASVRSFNNPAIGYNLNLDKINISRYLAPATETPATPVKTGEKIDIEIPLPTELLKSLNANGTLKAGSVLYEKLNPTNIVMTLKAKDGVININPLQTNMFKTQINATAIVDVRPKQPNYAITFNTQNLPIGEVLIAFMDDDKISGTGSVNANLTTSGDRLSLIKKGLNGTLSADLRDGAVKGFNLAQSIRQAKEKLGKQTVAANEELKTDFSSLTGSFVINNGLVDTKTLQAQAPFMRIDGSGTVDLVQEQLNYLVKAKIVATGKGQGGQELQELNGLTIPIKLTGALDAPKISLDLASLIEQKAKEEVKQRIEEKKEEVTEEVKEKLENKLKDGLLKKLRF